MGFCAGVGEAVAKIELGRVPALAISFKTFHRQPTDVFIDWSLKQPQLRRQTVEVILRTQRRHVAAAGKHHTGLKSDSR